MVFARQQINSREILGWVTPSEAPKALQASERSDPVDPTRANSWISAQHQPGKFALSTLRILGQGPLTVQRAGVGQQVKPTKCRAGGGWVGGSAYSHEAKIQTNLDESPQHLARPVSTGGHTTLPTCGVPTDFVKHITIPLTTESWKRLCQTATSKNNNFKCGMTLCNISQPLTAFSFALHPGKRHHDIGFAEFPGIAEYFEMRNSKNMLGLRGS